MKKAKLPLNNKHLESAFDQFNEFYFDNKLPWPTSIEFKKLSGKEGTTRFMRSGKVHIFINRNMRNLPSAVYITLLHEMAHVKTGLTTSHVGGTHGFIHGSEIVRLWNLGAYEDLL